MYRAVTRQIEVTVEPEFIAEQANEPNHRYAWSYTIGIVNHGSETVQLRSRYWHIMDGAGRVQEVRGVGVVGKQPVLKSGERFKYTSSVAIATSSGIMTGTYQMTTDTGETFDITIPAFSLDGPGERRTLN